MLAECCPVALAPAWHMRPGYKWSREMQPPEFPLLFMLQLQMWKSWTAPSLCTPEHHHPVCLQRLGAAQLQQSRSVAGGIWDTKLSVIQMLLPDPLSAAAQHRPAASQPCVPGDACSSLRAHLCTVQETHHRLQAEPTEKEVFNSTLKEDEKLRRGLIKCQRQMKRSQTKTWF